MREGGANAAVARRPGRTERNPSEQSDTQNPVGRDAGGYDAVLLAGFGGPDGPDDVMPFLRNVTAGRGVPDDRLAEVAQHYLALGGVSPINAQNRALRTALAAELAGRGIDLPVLWGNRNWQPFLADTIREAGAQGHRRILGVATSAYSSYSSCRQYREDFARALLDSGMLGRVVIDKVRPYYDTPGFLDPFVDGLSDALEAAAAQGLSDHDAAVVFTTHSIPMVMADRSGTTADGMLYVAQHLAACTAVAQAVSARTGREFAWQLAYQSRSGPPTVPWLEPDINDVLRELATAGRRGAIVVPIGFVSDHVEVIWDLDTEAAQTAAESDMWFHRVATPGTDPRFVAAVTDLIVERLRPGGTRTPSVTGLPARPDACPAGCCRGATLRPTTAGVDSAADWAAAEAVGAHGLDPVALTGSGLTSPVGV